MNNTSNTKHSLISETNSIQKNSSLYVVKKTCKGIKTVSPKNISNAYIKNSLSLDNKTKTKLASLEKKKIKNPTARTSNKLAVATQKRANYLSKNYRNQTIKKEIATKINKKIISSVVNGKSLTGLNIRTSIISNTNVKKISSVSLTGIKKINNVGKSINKTTKTALKFSQKGSALMKNLKIKEIVTSKDAYEVGANLAKSTATIILKLIEKLVSLILKQIGKFVMQILSSILPYILICFIPFFIILLIVGSGSAAAINNLNEETKNSNIAIEDIIIKDDVVWPVATKDGGIITSLFGNRSAVFGSGTEFHKGIDIGIPIGTQIVSIADGEVVLSTFSKSAGEYIIISHESGSYFSLYMHNNTREVKVGDTVKSGQLIATSGNTGSSGGPHLHFGISKVSNNLSSNDKYIDPAVFYNFNKELQPFLRKTAKELIQENKGE